MIIKERILKNKKADEKYLSPWLILILSVIAICIVIGVLMFLKDQADIRAIESNILSDKLQECLSDKFSLVIFSKADFDIFKYCSFNEGPFKEQEIYYFKLIVKDSAGDDVFSLISGNNWETECLYQMEKKVREKNFAQCSFNSFDIHDIQDNKLYSVTLNTGSNQI